MVKSRIHFIGELNKVARNVDFLSQEYRIDSGASREPRSRQEIIGLNGDAIHHLIFSMSAVRVFCVIGDTAQPFVERRSIYFRVESYLLICNRYFDIAAAVNVEIMQSSGIIVAVLNQRLCEFSHPSCQPNIAAVPADHSAATEQYALIIVVTVVLSLYRAVHKPFVALLTQDIVLKVAAARLSSHDSALMDVAVETAKGSLPRGTRGNSRVTADSNRVLDKIQGARKITDYTSRYRAVLARALTAVRICATVEKNY